jgi:hypothetical protein
MPPKNRIRTGEISIKVTGTERVQTNLKRFAKDVQQEMFIRAVKPSLEIIQDSAKRNLNAVPSKSGGSTRTKEAIASRISIKLLRQRSSAWFSRGRLAVWYGKPRGTRPPDKARKTPPLWVRASLAHLIEYGFRLTHFFGKKVRAQRIAERPFMRPAFEANKSKAERLFLSALRGEIGRTKP